MHEVPRSAVFQCTIVSSSCVGSSIRIGQTALNFTTTWRNMAETRIKRLAAHVCASPLAVMPVTSAPFFYNIEMPGKRFGRFIGDLPDDGSLADELRPHQVQVYNGRVLQPRPSLDTSGFELLVAPVNDVLWTRSGTLVDPNDEASVQRYCQAIAEEVRAATGARRVIPFDHTFRRTGVQSFNSLKSGDAAGIVNAVHCDNTDISGPRRVQSLSNPDFNQVHVSQDEVDAILAGDYAIINVWRSISDAPIQRNPLALLHPSSVREDDFSPYEMR